MNNHIEEFRDALASAGLNIVGPVQDDGKLHRYKTGDDSEPNSWYVLHHPDPIACGSFGCWKRNIKENWRQRNGVEYAPKDLAELKRKWAEDDRRREREEKERHERRAADAVKLISGCAKADEHDYLTNKDVPAYGDCRINQDGELLLPLQDYDGKVWSYQTIDFMGDKCFMPGGRIRGTFFKIGEWDDGPIVICEGYATGATIHRATKWPVVCAMNCGNLKTVASDIRKASPERIIVIAADNDRFTDNNPGLEKANEAAKASNCHVCVPDFPDNTTSGTDFNDLEKVCGQGVVRGQFESLLGYGMGQRITVKQLLSFVPEEAKDSVLGKRYLCKGGSCVIVAQTSAGKSSLGMQMAVCWAIGIDLFGLKPCKPLRSIYVQAENDIGDTAEMFQGVLAGMDLVPKDNPEATEHLVKLLEKNLIILRDQTHVGGDFSDYAKKLVEIHRPDLFWVDPMLSFYGDDINDQKSMSNFLRSQLNPISEKTGIIWMLLHHTGKPAKDASKTQKNWSARDFSYMGIGSSELSNWARAIICLTATSEDEFRMIFAKRGWRAGLMDGTTPATELSLAYSTDHICWRRIPKPKDEDDMSDEIMAFASTITSPTKATEIIRQASHALERGSRTCWKMWDSGSGSLGKYFVSDERGFWVCRKTQESKPYKDD